MPKEARINVRITERLKERLAKALEEDGYTEPEFITNAIHNYLAYRDARRFRAIDPLDTFPAVDRADIKPMKGADHNGGGNHSD